jgi:serine/threonine protein kinase
MAPDLSSALTPGSSVGDWTLVRKLGEGAMGVVFEARGRSGVTSALKIIRPDLLKNADHAARFKREGKLLQRLDHRNVVRFLDVGEANGFPFLALSFIEGDNLAARIAKGPLSPDEGLRLAKDLLRGLAAIHEAGILHRDLKPANVLHSKEGDWKITDFGLARRENEESIVVTRPGALLGTPHYMSPEQCLGEPLDARSDLYCAGATLYHALTGETLFKAATVMLVISAHIGQKPPDVSEKAKGLAPELVSLLGKLLAKKGPERPESARAALALLGEVETRPVAPAPSASDPDLAETLVSPNATRVMAPRGPGEARTPTASLPRPPELRTPSTSLPRPPELRTPSTALPRPVGTPPPQPRPTMTLAEARTPGTPPAEGAATPAEIRATKKFVPRFVEAGPARPLQSAGRAAGTAPPSKTKRLSLTPSGRVPGIIVSDTPKRGMRIPWERATLFVGGAALIYFLPSIAHLLGRPGLADWAEPRTFNKLIAAGIVIGVVRIFMGFFEVNAPPLAKSKSFFGRLWARIRILLLKRTSPRIAGKALHDLGEFSEAGDLLVGAGLLRDGAAEYLRAHEYGKAARVLEKVQDAPGAIKAYAKAGDIRAATLAVEAGYFEDAARFWKQFKKPVEEAEAWRKAGKHIEASLAYEMASRPEDAARSLISALEDAEGPLGQLPLDERHKEAVRAAGLLPRGQVALEVAPRFEALGELELAQQCFERGNDLAGAARLAERRGDNLRASELYRKAGRLEDAARAREAHHAARQASGEEAIRDPHESADSFIDQARSYDASGEPLRAADLFTRGGDLSSAARLYERAGSWREAALCYRKLGDPISAARALEHSDPIAAAQTWEQAGRHDEAMRVLATVSASSPHRARAVGLLGDVHMAAGHESEAAAAFAAALEGMSASHPDLARAGHYLQGLAQVGGLDRALDLLAKVRGKVGDLPELERARADLDLRKRSSVGGKDLVGCVVDRYKVTAMLGEGGTAWVYQAEHAFLGRQVALKVLKPLPEGSDLAERFYGEAQAVASMRHPNVIHVFDCGATPGGLFYMALELIPGDGLRKRLEKTPRLPIHVATRIASGVLAGLAAAHARGIVHRDLKPENILLTKDDRPKVVDFGIAKLTASKVVTMTGGFLGTPKYASPEQATGKESSAATDIYAAGLVLYEMLTGRSPFESATPLGFLTKHATAAPIPVGQLIATTPPALNAAVMRALEKEPARRWPDAESFRKAIAPFTVVKTQKVKPEAPRFEAASETLAIDRPAGETPRHLRVMDTMVEDGPVEDDA